MYTKSDIFIIVICAVLVIGIYIYRKASGDMWYGIQWKNVFRAIRNKLFK